MVVVFHASVYAARTDLSAAHNVAWWILQVMQRMWVGVPLFFVISGYCISATADATRMHRASTSSYFWRRFRRIFPPYWIVLAIYILFIAVLVHLLGVQLAECHGVGWAPQDLNFRHWLANLSLTEIWSHLLLGNQQRLFLGQAWSLCYEEIFYAVMGALLVFARRRLFLMLGLLSLLSVCGFGLACTLHLDKVQGPLSFWMLFASGVLVYRQINYGTPRQNRIAVAVLLAGIGLALLRPGQVLELSANVPQFMLAAFLFALFLMAVHRADSWMMSQPWLRPLQRCGILCYSLYLVHWPMVGFLSFALYKLGIRGPAATLTVTVPLCLGISLLMAELFHRGVERYFLNKPLAKTVRSTALKPALDEVSHRSAAPRLQPVL
jgi:peptidoglycan/LPS O-acetylase OafA/YrhL